MDFRFVSSEGVNHPTVLLQQWCFRYQTQFRSSSHSCISRPIRGLMVGVIPQRLSVIVTDTVSNSVRRAELYDTRVNCSALCVHSHSSSVGESFHS